MSRSAVPAAYHTYRWVATSVEDVAWDEQQRRIDSVAAQRFGD
jgi:hypothetical protein